MAKSKKVKEAELTASPVKPDSDWQAEDDFRTLMRAEEVKQDPERLKRAMKCAKKQAKAIRSIQDLKDLANQKHMEPDGDE